MYAIRIVLLGVVIAASLTAADWPHYRGPAHDGTSPDESPPVWNHTAPVAWRAKVGVGVSAVVVADGRAVTLGNRDGRDVVVCFDAATGAERWRADYPCPLKKRGFDGGPAASPVLAGDTVVVCSWDGRVHAYDLADGGERWQVNVTERYGGRPPRWQYAGSPTVLDDTVYLDIGGEGASTLALALADGSPV